MITTRPARNVSARTALLFFVLVGACTVLPAVAESAGSSSGKGEVSGPGLDEVAVLDLGPLQAVQSLAPPTSGRPLPRPASLAPASFEVREDEDWAGLPLAPVAYAVPSSLLADPPGVCVDGSNAGNACRTAAECPGGTCNLYRQTLYKNESTMVTWPTTYPRFVMDDIGLAGALATPPARISSIEFPFFLNEAAGLPAGRTMRVEIRFWETIDRAATPVNAGYLGGGAWLIPGPLPHNVFTFTGVLPPGSHIAPSDPDIAIQIDYRDDATNGLAYGTVVFSNGTGAGPQVGTSQNLYFRDVDGNGIFDPTDARQLSAPNMANFWLVLGGEYPTVEAEPNDTQGSATVTAPCFTLGAAISPAGDVDWFKFTLTAPQSLLMQVQCDGPSDDSTLTLRDGLGAIVGFNDDASPTDRCSRITQNLAAGVYFLEIHEKGDDDEIPGYRLKMGSGAVAVANLRWTDTSTQLWDPLPGGGSYDRIYGDLQILGASGLAASVVSCLDENLAVPTAGEARTPAAGQGFWYLVRGTDPCTGGPATYDEGGNQAAPRDPLIPPPPVDCNP